MFTVSRLILPLRALLVLLFGILIVFQTLSIPGGLEYMAKETPEEAYLRWPLTVIAVFVLLCVQVVIVSTWKLLSLVKSDRIFTTASMPWVNAIVWAIAAAWAVLVGVFMYVGFNADDPGMPMLLFLLLTGLTVFGLVVVVMRALLQQATALRTDLDGVI